MGRELARSLRWVVPDWVFENFSDHAKRISEHRSNFAGIARERIQRIAVVMAENESHHDVSLGDLIARVPMLEVLASLFPTAQLDVFLKPYHHDLAILPKIANVSYRAVKGNLAFRNAKFFRKDYRDIFSKDDLAKDAWDLLVDSSSRDGWRLSKQILAHLPAGTVGAFLPSNIVSTVWFANAHMPRYRLGYRPTLGLRADQLFVLRLLFHLAPHCTIDSAAVGPPRTALFDGRLGDQSSRKACLIVDKSPVSGKLWRSRNANPFDMLASTLQRFGWEVFVHRFSSLEEDAGEFPVYRLSRPTEINADLLRLVEFFRESRPAVTIGIDTGVLHFVAATIPRQAIMQIFVTPAQDPFVWAAPNAYTYVTFSRLGLGHPAFISKPLELVERLCEIAKKRNH